MSRHIPGAAPAPGADDRALTRDLLAKYDRPGPRYTSYPTAVEFADSFGDQAYRRHLGLASASDAPLSLYLHLPFCEARCTFCGCSVIVTKKREVAAHYLGYLHREIAMLAASLGRRRRLVQCHWGGGTPTYLTPAQMQDLHREITRHFDIDASAEVAIEIDPRVTTPAHIAVARELGFNRLSMGVQDFTPEVQQAVRRVQPEADTRRLFERARKAGFGSINIDLIYGLPLQTTRTFVRTLVAVLDMRPDRVAVYSFAHVPWLKGNQKGIRPEDLPDPSAKIALFVETRAAFLEAGYRQIGMDHFALPDDELARAAESGTLHRNFMGYTTKPAADMLGLGVSAIGDVQGAFAQNVKSLARYYEAIDAGRFPIDRGFALSDDDRLRRHVITNLMCNFRLDRRDVERRFGIDFKARFAGELAELEQGALRHGFVEIDSDAIRVTPRGRLFVRNICMAFDRYLQAKAAGPVFSRTV